MRLLAEMLSYPFLVRAFVGESWSVCVRRFWGSAWC